MAGKHRKQGEHLDPKLDTGAKAGPPTNGKTPVGKPNADPLSKNDLQRIKDLLSEGVTGKFGDDPTGKEQKR